MDAPDHYEVHGAFGMPLTVVQASWIGLLAVMWSQFEFIVEVGIYHLRGQTFSQGRGTELPRDITKRLSKLAALAGDHMDAGDRRIVLEICERGAVAAPRRNVAMHGHWMRHAALNEAAAVSWFRVPAGESWYLLPIHELPALVQEAGVLGKRLYEVLEPRGAFADMAP